MPCGKRKAPEQAPPPPSPTSLTDDDANVVYPDAQDVSKYIEAQVDAELRNVTFNEAHDEHDEPLDATVPTATVQTAIGMLSALSPLTREMVVMGACDTNTFTNSNDDEWLAPGTEVPISVLVQALSAPDQRSASIAVVLDKFSRIMRKTKCKRLRLSVQLE